MVSQDLNKDALIQQLVTKYKIVMPASRISTRVTRAEMKIGKTKFLFNKTAVAELGYPAQVFMYISDDAKQIVVAAAKKSDMTIPFFNPNKISGHTAIYNKGLANTIRNVLGWDAEHLYTIPAVACFDGEIVLFDLEQGYVRRKGERQPKITPLQTDDVLRQYPKVSEFIQSYQQLAIAERASEAAPSSREGIVETTYRDVSEEAHAACG